MLQVHVEFVHCAHVQPMAAPNAMLPSKWLVFIRPSLAGFDRPLTLLRLAISADEMTDESLVGRSAIIHEEAQNFQKYAADLNPMKARPWVKRLMGVPEGGHVWCWVFLTFSTHKRAKDFVAMHVAKCKHGGLFAHTRTHPHVVDLEDQIIQDWSGKRLEKLGAVIFKGQMESTLSDT